MGSNNPFIQLIQRLRHSALFKSVGAFFIASLINSALPFLLLPILTRALDTVDYGTLAMVQVLIGVVIPFIGLNTHGAITRRYYDRDEIDFPRYVANCLLLFALSATGVALIFVLVGEPIAHALSIPTPWLWAALTIATSSYLVRVMQSIWRVENRPVPFGIFQVSATGVELTMAILFVVGLRLGWQGRVWSTLITFAVFGLLGLVLLVRGGWVRVAWSALDFKHALRYGLPLVPHALAMWGMSMLDRLFINQLISISATGIYTVATQIAMILGVMVAALGNAWVPWFFEHLKRNTDHDRELAVAVSYAVMVALLAIALLLGLGAPLLLSILVGEAFQDAAPYVIILALGQACYGIYRIVVCPPFYADATHWVAAATTLSLALNIVGNLVLIPLFGLAGAAWATMLAYLASSIFIWIIGQRILPLPWHPRTILRVWRRLQSR